MKCQHDLDGTPLTVTEHLTKHTLQLQSLAGKLVGDHNVWTFKTVVYANHNNKTFTIKNYRDLKYLEGIVTKPQEKDTMNVSNSISDHQTNTTTTTTDNTSLSNPPDDNELRSTQRANFMLNFQSLCQSLFTTDPAPETPHRTVLRGRPSTNGRGRGLRRY